MTLAAMRELCSLAETMTRFLMLYHLFLEKILKNTSKDSNQLKYFEDENRAGYIE